MDYKERRNNIIIYLKNNFNFIDRNFEAYHMILKNLENNFVYCAPEILDDLYNIVKIYIDKKCIG